MLLADMRRLAPPAICVLIAATVLLSDPAQAKDPPANSPAYPAPTSELAKALQARLYDHGCYGNRLTRDGPDGEVDQNFGPRSRKALWVFIETVNSRLPRASRFSASSLRPQAILSAFGLPEISIVRQYCREFGSQFLNAYFTDANEHFDGFTPSDPGSQPPAGTCVKDDVGKKYVGEKGTAYSRLGSLLDTVLADFDTIFPAGRVDFTANWDFAVRKKLEDHGTKPVDREAVRKTLRETRRQWSGLSFSYGLKNNCDLCYRINDWIYLRNMAQSNGGHLVRAIKNEDGTVAYYRAQVSSITETMLKNIIPLIKLHRGVTSNLNLHFAYLAPGGLPAGMDAAKVSERALQLSQVRDETMQSIIEKLNGATDNDRKVDPTNRYLSDLANKTRCEGFDGSSVDQ